MFDFTDDRIDIYERMDAEPCPHKRIICAHHEDIDHETGYSDRYATYECASCGEEFDEDCVLYAENDGLCAVSGEAA